LGVFETDFTTRGIVGDTLFNEIFGFDQPRNQRMGIFYPYAINSGAGAGARPAKWCV
jgi:hypothetical protein